MNLRSRFICASIALLALFPVRPGSISGIVTGPDHKPLKDVEVSISGSQRPSVTGNNGRFAFTGLAPGHYDVTAKLDGYESMRQRFVVEAGQDTPIEIKLSPARRSAVLTVDRPLELKIIFR